MKNILVEYYLIVKRFSQIADSQACKPVQCTCVSKPQSTVLIVWTKMFPNMNIFVTIDRPSKIILEIRKKYFGKILALHTKTLSVQNVELTA